MQRYYRTVMDVSLLNEMLLQLFRRRSSASRRGADRAAQRTLPGTQRLPRDHERRTCSHATRRRCSSCSDCCSSSRAAGRQRATIRALGRHLWLIDEEFRQNPRHHRLFLDFMRAPQGVTHELRRMNLYGVLGRYIPAFGRIVGSMQYDLFHAYTVDAHTLFVVRNLRRLALPRFEHEFPTCRG
jgi:[protein-PII] uridylyltransferase